MSTHDRGVRANRYPGVSRLHLMLNVESFFHGSHFVSQLRTIIDMSTSGRNMDKPPRQRELPDAPSSRSPGPAPKQRPCRRSRRITRPEPGSLYDIMREHSGLSLFVLPICWTDVHAQLLGARFDDLDPVLRPVPGSRHCGWNANRPSQIANTLSRELTTFLSGDTTRPYFRHRAIKDVMKILFPGALSRSKTSAELDLFFGGRVFRKAVRIPVLWRTQDCAASSFDSTVTRPASSFNISPPSSLKAEPSSSLASNHSSNQPILAYIDRAQLNAIRKNLYRVCTGPEHDRRNTPVYRLQQLRSKTLIPANADHDAHYVSVLLAMAQALFFDEAPSASKPSSQTSNRSTSTVDLVPSSFHDVTVRLLTHSDYIADFVVYTAVVSATFLQRFARPSKAPRNSNSKPMTPDLEPGESMQPEADVGMRITVTHVPIWPVLGLKERLGKALGRDIAGEDTVFASADAENVDSYIETWETPEERRHGFSASLKRPRRGERDALAEVLNSSFEVTDDDAASCASDDRPVLSPDAKRRCTRSRPIETLEVF